MNVLRISEEEGNVVVKLTADDLTFICNELYAVSATMKENGNSIAAKTVSYTETYAFKK